MVEWIPENQTSLRPMSRRLAFRVRGEDGEGQVGPVTRQGTILVQRLLKVVVGLEWNYTVSTEFTSCSRLENDISAESIRAGRAQRQWGTTFRKWKRPIACLNVQLLTGFNMVFRCWNSHQHGVLHLPCYQAGK